MATRTSSDPKRDVENLIKGLQIGQERNLMAGSSAGKYGEGGPSTPVNRETMPWLYPDDEPGTDPAEVFEQLELPLDTVKRLQELMISGGVLLPGESPAGGKGGLGSMNKDQLERWIKENGITGPGADKIRNKWKNLGPNLPLASNVNYGKPTALDNLLKPAQDKYGPGLNGMPDQERINLLIRGTKV